MSQSFGQSRFLFIGATGPETSRIDGVDLAVQVGNAEAEGLDGHEGDKRTRR